MIFLSSKIERQAREGECERREDNENQITGQRNKDEGGGRDKTKTEGVKAPHIFCKRFSSVNTSLNVSER